MWINGVTNVDNVYYLTLQTLGANYTFVPVVKSFYQSIAFGTFGTLADAQASLDEFLATLGHPWVAIGDFSVGAAVAVNMAQVTQMQDNTTGVKFCAGDTSDGFAPWSDYASATAGLLAIAGNINIGL